MGSTEYPGIDYGLGKTNKDANGVRYGVLSQHALGCDMIGEFEPVSVPRCPDCGEELDADEEPWGGSEHTRDELVSLLEGIGVACYDEESTELLRVAAIDSMMAGDLDDINGCPKCGVELDEDSVWPEEADAWVYKGDGYEMHLDGDGDVWVTKSPWVTRAQFCSPCAPGAGYLTNPCEDGPLTYCLGPEWFDDEIRTYEHDGRQIEYGQLMPYVPVKLADVS